MPKPSSTSDTAADSPVLAQLKARVKMLQDKIDRRIPASADRKPEALARAQAQLQEVNAQIAELTKQEPAQPES